MRFKDLPRLIRFLLTSIFVNIVILTIMRLIFWNVFNSPNDAIPSIILLKSFYVGAKFDLRLLLIINLPLLTFAWIKPIAIFDSTLGRRLWTGCLTLSFMTVLLFYFVDFGYYAYLETRLDSTILRFFYNPLVSLKMVLESYPVFWAVLLFFLLAAAYWILTNLLINKINRVTIADHGVLKKCVVTTLFVFVYLFGIYGKISYYPLRWSDAFFSTHAFASALSLNPVLFFIDTFKNKEVRYDKETVKNYYDTISDFLGVAHKDKEKLNFKRVIKGNSSNIKQPNVVMVILESFAYNKTSLSGNPLNPSPFLAAIAKDGILFNRFYTPHGGTARSVFTAVTGIPDIEMVKTSSRNPLIVEQHTIINEFEGYEKLYFLGGSSNWGEIRGLLSHNIKDLQVFEEGSYSSPRIDVWGISDMDLFKEANIILSKKKEKPFFAIIQTSGNHRPYTIPEDNNGFKSIPAEQDLVLKYGFRSVAAYNSFRFMDHCIGSFMDTIKKEDYYNNNTIFVFFGDHGLVRNATHMHKSEDQLLLTRYHVPFVLYAPGLINEGKTYDKVASEVDVLPTIASLASIPYVNSTFGKDLLDKKYDEMRYAFTIKHKQGPELGLIGDQFYFFINADKTNRRLHRIYSDIPRENIIEKFPDVAAKMEHLCFGIFETAKYIRFHNSPKEVAGKVELVNP